MNLKERPAGACGLYQVQHARSQALCGPPWAPPKTASISPDVNDPAARNITFEQLRRAYLEQTLALVKAAPT